MADGTLTSLYLPATGSRFARRGAGAGPSPGEGGERRGRRRGQGVPRCPLRRHRRLHRVHHDRDRGRALGRGEVSGHRAGTGKAGRGSVGDPRSCPRGGLRRGWLGGRHIRDGPETPRSPYGATMAATSNSTPVSLSESSHRAAPSAGRSCRLGTRTATGAPWAIHLQTVELAAPRLGVGGGAELGQGTNLGGGAEHGDGAVEERLAPATAAGAVAVRLQVGRRESGIHRQAGQAAAPAASARRCSSA